MVQRFNGSHWSWVMLTDPVPSLDEVRGVLRVEHSKWTDERMKDGWKAFGQVFSADTSAGFW